MTTESRPATSRERRSSGDAVLAAAAGVVVLTTVVATVVGAYAVGADAARGAAAGGAVAVLVLSFGTFSLNVVSRVMPAASLALAMLTYLFQMALTLVILLGISRSGALETSLDRRWLGLTLIIGVIAWMVGHVVAAQRARIPAFEPVVGSASRQTGVDAR